jgi:thioredoxin reductase (NADPH)
VATHSLIIVGAGPAGLTAAVYAARSNLHPLVIEGPNPGGQLMGTTYVENWPGTSKILGPTLMQQMREHAAGFGTQFLSETVVSCDFSSRPFTLTTNKQKLTAHAVIIASGATPRKIGCPGENEYWGKGVTTCAVCDGAFYQGKPVVVVGGGDTAMEDASFLAKYTANITIVQMLDKLTACHAMQQRALAIPGIKIIYNSTVTEIQGNGSHAQAVLITNRTTGQQTRIPADGVFTAVGLTPRTDFLSGQIKLTPAGFIEAQGTSTSVPGVFAAGDVADMQYRQAVTAAGSGCRAALDAQRYLETVK